MTKYKKLPHPLSIIGVMEAATDDCGAGFCLICGQLRDGFTEPDACNYPCTEGCGDHVFGAQEIIIMFVA